jgi:2-polyprenyl-3-methyl-5-hydroxy-6-metoxy-1,4-benzoquinol methylase
MPMREAVQEGGCFSLQSAPTLRRPEFQWSYLWKAPVHDFPIRDEILFQFLPCPPHAHVLEIGPGSGFTAFRLAPSLQRITLIDASAQAVERVRKLLSSHANVGYACADVCEPGLHQTLGKKYDIAFSLDVFEYVADPAACLRNLAAVLRANGELMISYPNMPPPIGDGVTWFHDSSQLERLLQDAGFQSWEIFSVRMRPYSAAMYWLFHEFPLRLYRRIRNGSRTPRPQIYEETWAFQHDGRLRRFNFVLEILWMFISWIIRISGDVFLCEPANGDIVGHQLVIRAKV